jgi:hypothetical protein
MVSSRFRRWRTWRRAGIRTLTRPLGGAGLAAEAEAEERVAQIEDWLRAVEAGLSEG